MALTTSGIPSSVWQKAWLPWSSSYLTKSPPLPEVEARLAEGLGLEAEHGLDAGANDGDAVREA
eukprot:9305307-Alexandrium_andersonii.AAC.1